MSNRRRKRSNVKLKKLEAKVASPSSSAVTSITQSPVLARLKPGPSPHADMVASLAGLHSPSNAGTTGTPQRRALPRLRASTEQTRAYNGTDGQVRATRSRSLDGTEGDLPVVHSMNHTPQRLRAKSGLSPAAVRQSATEILSQFRVMPVTKGRRLKYPRRASVGAPPSAQALGLILAPGDTVPIQLGPTISSQDESHVEHVQAIAAVVDGALVVNPDHVETKDMVLSGWLNAYTRALPKFSSLVVECEVLLQQARTAGFTLGFKPELMTAAAFDVLDKVTPHLGIYSHLMGRVRKMIAASVYKGRLPVCSRCTCAFTIIPLTAEHVPSPLPAQTDVSTGV